MHRVAIERISDSERALQAAEELVFEYVAITAAESGRGPWNTRDDLPERIATELADLINFYSSPSGFFVAFTGDSPIGCGGLHFLNEETADIRRIYVRVEYRERGVARRLMDACFALAKENGFRHLVVDIVPQRTDVIDWYRRLGFVNIDPFETIEIEMVYLGKSLLS